MTCSSCEKNPVGNRCFCLKTPFFVVVVARIISLNTKHSLLQSSWQGPVSSGTWNICSCWNFPAATGRCVLSRRNLGSCTVAVIRLKKAASAGWVSGASIPCTPPAFLPSGSLPSDGGNLLVGISVPSLHAKSQLSSGVVWAPHSLPREELLGRAGWETQIIPKKGWGKGLSGHQELLDEQLWVSWSSTEDPAEVTHLNLILDCLSNPHFPWKHWGKPSLITTLTGFLIMSAMGLCCHNKKLFFTVMPHVKIPL